MTTLPRRRRRSGIALLMTLTSLVLMITIVTEVAFKSTVRLKLSVNHRDEAKAEQLALSGMGMYRLLLVQSKSSQASSLLRQFGMSGDMIWQEIPYINTSMMRMLFVTDGGLDAEEAAQFELTDEQREDSREGSAGTSKRSFLDFEGDFTAEVTDEDQKINVRLIQAADFAALEMNPSAVQLYSLMTGEDRCAELNGTSNAEQDDDRGMRFFYDRGLEPWELIGNLADWTDADSTRAYQGGDENSLYDRLDDPYLPKNAALDTFDEIRLIDGWHRDDVWARFGKNLTVYGDGKININTAPCEVLWALIKSYANPMPPDDQVLQAIRSIEESRGFFPFGSAQQFVTIVSGEGINPTPDLVQRIKTESTVFRVISIGQVADARVQIEAVFEFPGRRSPEGIVHSWKVQ